MHLRFRRDNVNRIRTSEGTSPDDFLAPKWGDGLRGKGAMTVGWRTSLASSNPGGHILCVNRKCIQMAYQHLLLTCECYLAVVILFEFFYMLLFFTKTSKLNNLLQSALPSNADIINSSLEN